MSLSTNAKRLRSWLRRRGWSTNRTPTGIGVHLEGEPQAGTNYITGAYRWHAEHLPLLEIDRFNPSKLGISVYKRITFTAGPDYERNNKPFPTEPETYIEFSRDEIHHILELMDECIKEKIGANGRLRHE